MTFSRKALLKRFRLTHIIVVLRFVLAVTLLAFLVELGALDFQQFTRIFNIPGTIFTSLVLMGSAVVLSVYRW